LFLVVCKVKQHMYVKNIKFFFFEAPPLSSLFLFFFFFFFFFDLLQFITSTSLQSLDKSITFVERYEHLIQLLPLGVEVAKLVGINNGEPCPLLVLVTNVQLVLDLLRERNMPIVIQIPRIGPDVPLWHCCGCSFLSH